MARLSELADLADEAPGDEGASSYDDDLEAEASALVSALKAGDAAAVARAFRNMHEMCADKDESANAFAPTSDDDDDDEDY